MPKKPNGLYMGLRREGTHPYRVPLGAKLGLPTLAALGGSTRVVLGDLTLL